MVDHFPQFGVRNGALYLHGVPVFLVHVIAGRDFVVTIT
jgi:hypothetical protein